MAQPKGEEEPGAERTGGLPKLLTIPQVAAVLGLKARTLEEWVRRGRIKYYRVGRSVRFRPADVEQFLETRCRVGR